MDRMRAKVFQAGAVTSIAVALSLCAGVAGATKTAPKACASGRLAVSVNGKRECFVVAKAIASAPGVDVVDMLIRASAKPNLWRRPAFPSMYTALGPNNNRGLLKFERTLYATSQAVGKPLLPDVPVQPAGGGALGVSAGDTETLGLTIPPPVQMLINAATRKQGGTEETSGVQTKDAVTEAELAQSRQSGTGQYSVAVKEEFAGDPCPGLNGVTGKASYSVTREASDFSAFIHNRTVENVATVTVSFSATVSKKARSPTTRWTSRSTARVGGAGRHSRSLR